MRWVARYSARQALCTSWYRGSWAIRCEANQRKPSVWQSGPAGAPGWRRPTCLDLAASQGEPQAQSRPRRRPGTRAARSRRAAGRRPPAKDLAHAVREGRRTAIRRGPSSPRRGSRPATDRNRPPVARSGLPGDLGTRIDADLGISLSTIRFRASPRHDRAMRRQRRSS